MMLMLKKGPHIKGWQKWNDELKTELLLLLAQHRA